MKPTIGILMCALVLGGCGEPTCKMSDSLKVFCHTETMAFTTMEEASEYTEAKSIICRKLGYKTYIVIGREGQVLD